MNKFRAITIIIMIFSAYFLSLEPLAAGIIQPEGNLTAVWANEGGDKVTRDELRGTNSADSVNNSVWNGTTVQIFGTKNEVVAFNLILEAGSQSAENISVSLASLTGPGGATIATTDSSDLFNWSNRNIELFYVRYLQIKGLSLMSYETYDERHIPASMRRSYDSSGIGSGTWNDRPNHDKYYPDIAVPLELVSQFDVTAASNQSIWVDIYIPKTASTGLYTGNITIHEQGTTVASLAVELTVRGFILPDEPNSKTMVYFSRENINTRYFGDANLDPDNAAGIAVRNRHFQLAHRHKISLIDSEAAGNDQPGNEWLSRLDGTLFTSTNGYAGPGEATGNNIYSIGTYGSWTDYWSTSDEAAMQAHAQAWADWFAANANNTEYFLYLIDESDDYTQIEQWAGWINNAPGAGSNLKSLATMDMTTAITSCPGLDISPSWFTVGVTQTWQDAVAAFENDTNKHVYFYNGIRPATGSFATEDDGIALRQLAWAQYKKGIDRWFKWESTYYNNFQGDMGETNVFSTAQTFGTYSNVDSVLGETGWNYSNGDGVLLYPGTDTVYPAESYGASGPIASLRLKQWRRGIQDVDYLVMAAAIDSAATQQIVNSIVPTVLWEYGVDDNSDPTYVRTDISWSIDPDTWEAARLQLANIIETQEEEEVEVGAGGHCSIAAATTSTTWYLAEGCTNGYATWLCVQNPSSDSASLKLTYMDEDGNTVVETETLTGNRRFTRRINAVNGMKNKGGVATKVESTNDIGIIAERAMYWPGGGHCSVGVTAPASTWYLAEGSTNGYDTWILLQNSGSTYANVTLTYMDENGNTFQESTIVSAQRRFSRRINNISSMNNKSGVSTKVESTNSVDIIAERAMYWTGGGHCSAGTTASATTWYLAEGSTNGYSTWILLQNPNENTANITISYMDEDGNTFQEAVTVSAQRRFTRSINDISSMNNKGGVSTTISSTNGIGIIAERAMYWTGGGHCSAGTTAAATSWYLAEGCTNGYSTWILLQNPNDNTANIRLTYMDEDGNTFQEAVTVSAQRRFTRKINDITEMNNKGGVSTRVESTNEVGIIAERSMYWLD